MKHFTNFLLVLLIFIVSCGDLLKKSKYGKYDKDFYHIFDENTRVASPDEDFILRASEFGLKVNNGCYDSEIGKFNKDDIDPRLIDWLVDYNTSYFCEKQTSRFSYFKILKFKGLYKKQKNNNDYFLFLFRGVHINEDESSKVVVVLNNKEQLYAVNTSLWE